VLKIGYFGKQIRNTSEVFECGAREEWRSFELIMGGGLEKKKYHTQSSMKGISYLEYNKGRLTGLVTC
jgi:hypothetical protein